MYEHFRIHKDSWLDKMDHYCKGKNQEELLSKDSVPISNLPDEFSWIEVTGSTRIKNIIGNLGKMLRQDKFLVLSGIQ